MDVDLILLSRDLSPPREDVWRGIQIQDGVDVRVHRIEGTAHSEDPNRYETIARARNRARTLGTSPWVMFLDDDVVLGQGCLGRLVQGLERRNGFAALGADCAGEMAGEWENWDYPRHVGMAATLFRREPLEQLTFRWQPGKCECRCCCDDLRRAGFGIGYLAGARAWHRPVRGAPDPRAEPTTEREWRSSPGGESGTSTGWGRILTAFDRNHFLRFRRQFLTTLRASGNREPLTGCHLRTSPGTSAGFWKRRGSRSWPSERTVCRRRCEGCTTSRMSWSDGRKTLRSHTGMPETSFFKDVWAALGPGPS